MAHIENKFCLFCDCVTSHLNGDCTVHNFGKPEKIKNDTPIPEQLDCPDIEGLRKMLYSHLQNKQNGTTRDDDDHYIFESVLEAFYGRDIWKWYNSQRD